jgi:hypothetical protein
VGEGVFIFLEFVFAETNPDIYSFSMLIEACFFYSVFPHGSDKFITISIFFSSVSFATIVVIYLVLSLGHRGQILTWG